MEIDQIKAAVVKIVTGVATGSGTYLRDLRAVITNYHVVKGERRVAVELPNGDRHIGDVLTVNPQKDIALVIVDAELDLPAVGIARRQVTQQEQVFAVGYPYNLPLTVTAGIVSSPEHKERDLRFIQTDAAINPGNSGGPLVNREGEIVGMNTQIYRDAQNIGFALPAEYLVEEIEMFKEDAATEGFNVRCPSCTVFLSEASEYCDNCGVKRGDTDYFQERPLNHIERFVEGEIAKTGRDPLMARQGSHLYWEFYRGSAMIRVFVYRNNFLFGVAPLAKLPRKNIVALYKYLLSAPISPYRFTMTDDIIYLAYRTHLSDLSDSGERERIGRELMAVADKADELDTYLVNTFKCRWASESRQEAEASS